MCREIGRAKVGAIGAGALGVVSSKARASRKELVGKENEAGLATGIKRPLDWLESTGAKAEVSGATSLVGAGSSSRICKSAESPMESWV